jgi:hypothetical protein
MTDTPEKPSQLPKSKEKQGAALKREARLAASLKQNLARRKAQSKGRETPDGKLSESSVD